jgi:hypothetical protein
MTERSFFAIELRRGFALAGAGGRNANRCKIGYARRETERGRRRPRPLPSGGQPTENFRPRLLPFLFVRRLRGTRDLARSDRPVGLVHSCCELTEPPGAVGI